MHQRGQFAASFECPWMVYGMNWNNSRDKRLLAVTSFTEEYTNHLQILRLVDNSNSSDCPIGTTKDSINDMEVDETNKPKYSLQSESIVEHPYPATKVIWSPDGNSTKLATTADYLRIWDTQGDTIQNCMTLSKFRHRDNCSPLTSADWNTANPNILGTSSLDTTICIWDLNNQKAPMKEIVAHDAEVYDMAFSTGTNIFGSVGGDGSLRVFDLRNLDSCTLLYETTEMQALVRLAWNKLDTNYIAAIFAEGSGALILDLRLPTVPVMELSVPSSVPGEVQARNINAVSWSPMIPNHICTAGESDEIFVWDINQPSQQRQPVLRYNGGAYVNQLHWAGQYPSFLALAANKSVQVVAV